MIDAAGPWGTGPFILASGVSQLAKRSPEVILEPNPNYWNAERKPTARIVFDNIISKADAIKSVESGDGTIDVVTTLTPAEAHAFKAGGHAQIVEDHAKTVLAGVFNQNKADSPWKDLAVRKALNMSVDRKALLAKAAYGYGMVIPAMIQPDRFGYNSSLQPYAVDANEASSAIKGAHIKDSTVTIAAVEAQRPIVDALTEQLAKVGLKVKGVYGEEPGKDWDIKLVEHFDWSPEFPVGVVHREFFGKDGAFRTMPEDPKFDALYAKVLATPDLKQQEKVVEDVEKYVYDQANVLFLYSPSTLFAVADRVSFVPYDTMMLELAETSINKKKAEAH